MSAAMVSGRRRDPLGGSMALGFVVLLLASEAALSLPDEHASDARVASFYVQHRGVIIALQVVGLVAAGLLAAYCARLRRVDVVAGNVGLLTAVFACAPALVTLVIAVVADLSHPAAAGTWNALEPRADDLLFVGITAFGAAIAVRPAFGTAVRALGAVVALLCGARLVLEAAGQDRGTFDNLGPTAFIVLVAVLGLLSLTGRLATATPAVGAGREPVSGRA